MSDENKLVTHSSIHHKVAEAIKGSGSTVEEALIEALTQSEINKRIQIAQTGLKAISALKTDLNKISRPDLKTYVEGVEHAAYSEARHKETKQIKEKLEKLENAFEKALNESTGEAYAKLDELSKNSGGGKGQAAAEA